MVTFRNNNNRRKISEEMIDHLSLMVKEENSQIILQIVKIFREKFLEEIITMHQS